MPEQLVSDAIRSAVQQDPRSRNQIASDANVDPSTVSRLMGGQRSSTLNVVDRICRALRLRLVPEEGPQRRKKAGK